MTDLERLQHAANLLAQRCANLTAELVVAQVEAEAQKRRAEAAEAKIAEADKLASEVK